MAIGFIGDLTDQSPLDEGAPTDSAAVIRLLLELDREGLATLVPGNHCFKLLRYLVALTEGKGAHERLSLGHGLAETIAEIMAAEDRDDLVTGYIRIVGSAPLWRRIGTYLFVHAAAHPAMFTQQAPSAAEAIHLKDSGIVHRALFGQTDGTRDANGYPVRLYDWLEIIPQGHTVVIGHDACADIMVRHNTHGGRLIRIDTGAGKGGKLSWIDLSASELTQEAMHSA